jgi:hypothetical protein
MTNATYDLDNPDELGYLNVYVLSLPAFRWFQTPATTTTRRCSHTCAVIGNRQMISIGGRAPSTLNPLGMDQDSWKSGVGILDMTIWEWNDHFDAADEPYERADVVKQYYNNSYVEPSWSDPALASIFGEFPSHTRRTMPLSYELTLFSIQHTPLQRTRIHPLHLASHPPPHHTKAHHLQLTSPVRNQNLIPVPLSVGS